MKLCKDCKYSEMKITLLKCNRPIFISLTDSCLESVNTYCSTERSDRWLVTRLFDTCGKEGRYFNSKEKV